MKSNYSDSKKRRLLDLKENLKDVELEKKITFNQDGLHLWSNEVSEQFSEFDKEIENYKKQIAKVENKHK
ncbi:hypothetical protein [Alkalibaculum bacchi]|uniref:hypothetical protein n=1 Tax=Alkalibaculum bacchi TaxID=645887 RepID=UPI0026F1D8EA|nr:hypothetical protein [Alkalibaculum bacchi]